MKKLLMDMKLIDSEHMFNKILEDDNVKNQIYGYIESVGGVKKHFNRYANEPRNWYEIAKIRKISKLQLQQYFRIRLLPIVF